jgi:DNA polymerase III subunit gamma/tau
LLDQLASTGQAITLQMAQYVLGTAASQAVLDVVDALAARRPADGLDHIHAALDSGSDPRQFGRQLVDYLRDLLLIRMGNATQVDATPELRVQMARHAQAFSTPDLLSIIRSFNSAAVETRGSWQPALPLEMAFVEALQDSTAADQPAVEPQASAQPAAGGPGRAATARSALGAGRPAAGASAASPAPAAPPAGGQAATPTAEAGSAQALAAAWQQVLAQVRPQSPGLYALMNSSTSRALRGDTLTINFASDVLKTRMDKPDLPPGNLHVFRLKRAWISLKTGRLPGG